MAAPNSITNERELLSDFPYRDWRESWKKCRENTASSPFGPHYGQGKAVLPQRVLSEIEWRLARIPLRFGFSPKSYRTSVYVLIEKKPGVREATKMRFIRLFHSRFNMTNKYAGRLIKRRGDSLRILPKEQGGGSEESSSSNNQCM